LAPIRAPHDRGGLRGRRRNWRRDVADKKEGLDDVLPSGVSRSYEMRDHSHVFGAEILRGGAELGRSTTGILCRTSWIICATPHQATFPGRPFFVVAEDPAERAQAAQNDPNNRNGRKIVDSVWGFRFRDEIRRLTKSIPTGASPREASGSNGSSRDAPSGTTCHDRPSRAPTIWRKS
jgi:hypothetical protein